MPSLADIQDAFANALLSTTTPVPSCLKGAAIRRADRRFAVYRNNVAASLIDAVA
ncbi:MAG: putative DNA-binding domain-containing protein, partial [Methyloceanibacter sp.]